MRDRVRVGGGGGWFGGGGGGAASACSGAKQHQSTSAAGGVCVWGGGRRRESGGAARRQRPAVVREARSAWRRLLARPWALLHHCPSTLRLANAPHSLRLLVSQQGSQRARTLALLTLGCTAGAVGGASEGGWEGRGGAAAASQSVTRGPLLLRALPPLHARAGPVCALPAPRQSTAPPHPHPTAPAPHPAAHPPLPLPRPPHHHHQPRRAPARLV